MSIFKSTQTKNILFAIFPGQNVTACCLYSKSRSYYDECKQILYERRAIDLKAEILHVGKSSHKRKCLTQGIAEKQEKNPDFPASRTMHQTLFVHTSTFQPE